MIRRPVTVAGLIVTAALAGCGGTSDNPAAATSVPPVSLQLHDALTSALHHSPPARLPYVGVGDCTGPATAGPGNYRCQTTPSPRNGVSELRVAVRPDGTWSTRPIPVVGVIHGHRATAASGLWGVGLHLP
jgi:hypothetical protein